MQQGGGEHQPLFHAMRIAFGGMIDEFRQLKIANFTGHSRGRFFAAQAIQIGNELQEFATRKFFVKIGLIGHVPDATVRLPGFADHVVPANAHGSAGGAKQVQQNANGRRLAGSVVT